MFYLEFVDGARSDFITAVFFPGERMNETDHLPTVQQENSVIHFIKLPINQASGLTRPLVMPQTDMYKMACLNLTPGD